MKSLSWDDEEVVRELYAGSIGEATRLAYLVVGDHHAAEDLAHDAFVRVASRLGALRNSAAFSAYLRRTVVNLSVSRLRRNRIEERALSLWSNSAVGSSPMDEVSTREGLRMAIQALPARQKAAIVVHFYLDLSETQTAEVLDCSRGAAKSLISRGLGRLRVEVSKGEWQDALS